MAKKAEPQRAEQSNAGANRPPALTRADVLTYCGETSVSRGKRYVRSALSQMQRTGPRLRALCQGSEYRPYRVSAEVGDHKVLAGDCSCPAGGRCKHIAALLLAYAEDAGAFAEVEDIEKALERLEKAQLVALIRRMVTRYPSLEALVTVPAVTPGKPPDAKTMQEQVCTILQKAAESYDEYDDPGVADALEPFMLAAERYADAGEWAAAGESYQTVADEIIEHYEEVSYADSLIDVLVECVTGIGRVLTATENAEARDYYLHALFNLYESDPGYSGLDVEEAVLAALRAAATLEERTRVAQWMRTLMDSVSVYQREGIGNAIFDLTGEAMPLETRLEILRTSGRQVELAVALFEAGRSDEAMEVVRAAQGATVIEMADLLRSRGDDQGALELVGASLDNPAYRKQYLVWLRERARERGDDARVLHYTHEIYKAAPSTMRYEELRALAVPTGRWPELRTSIIRGHEKERNWVLLVQLYLIEKEIGPALAALEKIPAAQREMDAEEALHLRVAQAAEEPYPTEAIAIYYAAVQRLIEAKQRPGYIVATTLLARIRALYTKLGAPDAWQAIITDIRTCYPKRYALREELDRAKLH